MNDTVAKPEMSITKNKKLSILESRDLYIVLSATYAFIKMSPYFLWHSSNVLKTVSLLIIPALNILIGVYIRGSKLRSNQALSASFILAFGLIITLAGNNNFNGFLTNILMYLSIAIFICQEPIIQSKIFKLFCFIYALSLIPGAIVYVLKLFGITIPHKTIYSINQLKTSVGHYYELYIGSVIYRAGVSFSYCGMFDEPGLVGTFSGLLLSARFVTCFSKEKSRTDKFIDIVLLISGLLSSSKAFFVIIFVALLFYFLSQGRVKAFFGVLSVFVVLVVALNLDTNYEAITEIQAIIDNYTSTGTIYLGRAHSGFNVAYNEFLRESPRFILFGHGLYSSQQVQAFAGSAEIRMLVYDIGYVGVVLLIIWLIRSPKRIFVQNRKFLSFQNLLIVVFILSMYQRQYVLTNNYIVSLFGGSAYISLNDKSISKNVEGLQ